MRNVVYAINLSIDGCCDHTKIGGSEEMLEYYTKFFQDIDLIVYGRTTYELMIPYWPDVIKDETSAKAEIDFAQAFVGIDKVVFSRTLQTAEKGTRIIRGDLGNEILQLKQQAGKKISVGGVSLPAQLIALGLVDEFYFVIHPYLVGEGRRLLEEGGLPDRLKLTLVDSKTFKSGAIALHYVK